MPAATLTTIHGTAIPAGTELEGVAGVISTPPHSGRSVVMTGSAFRADNNRDRLYRQRAENRRIPYDCNIIGVRIRGDQDLSAKTLGTMQYVLFNGDSALSASTIRGRSESIVASRWVPDGGYYYIYFSSPIAAQRGDQSGLYFQETLVNNEPMGTLGITSLSSKASGLDGVTSTSTFTSATATFQTSGVAAGYQLQLHTLSAVNSLMTYTIESVDSETQLTITGTFPTNGTGFYYEVSRFSNAKNRGVSLLRSAADLSGDGPHDMSTNFDLLHDYSILPMTPILDRAPYLALVGDSIMAGSTSGNYGSLQSWPNVSSTYDTDYDLGMIAEGLSGWLSMTLGVSGKDLEDIGDGPPWRITGGGDSEEAELVTQYRPTIAVACTLANDCQIPWNQATYDGYLDALKSIYDGVGTRMVLTTGTPLPGRSAPERALASDMRDWLRSWGAANGVTVIDTEPDLRETTEDTLPAEYDSGDGIHPTIAGLQAYTALIVAGVQAGGARTRTSDPRFLRHRDPRFVI